MHSDSKQLTYCLCVSHFCQFESLQLERFSTPGTPWFFEWPSKHFGSFTERIPCRQRTAGAESPQIFSCCLGCCSCLVKSLFLFPSMQALKTLRTAEFKPYVIFVRPPIYDQRKPLGSSSSLSLGITVSHVKTLPTVNSKELELIISDSVSFTHYSESASLSLLVLGRGRTGNDTIG